MMRSFEPASHPRRGFLRPDVFAAAMKKRLALVSFLALLSTGCAAGPGAPSRPADPPGPAVSAAEERRRREYAAHAEFRNQPALARIRAHHAYARGATGKGVTLGIVDSGVDPAHPRFEGKLETANVEGYDPDFTSCPDRAPDGTCDSLLGHGTFVGGIMAGNRRAVGNTLQPESAVHGVAFDAGVISVGFPSLDRIIEEIVADEALPENPTPGQVHHLAERIQDVESMMEERFASAFRRLNSKVTAVNCSFGLPGNIEDFSAGELRARFPNVIEAMAEANTPVRERTVYVWAAGNAGAGSGESATSVEVAAGLPARIPELRGHTLAVVATDPQGRIADFSNRCGIAREFCLAAPGVDVTGPAPGFYCPDGTEECYLRFRDAGTSAAAPFVTGGIALLAQHYRNQLGNDAIVNRILETADKRGVYQDPDVYGQGFLDLDAATRPVGGMRMLAGRTLGGPSAPSRGSALRMGAAFGDALARALARREVASFDELDAPFFRPLGDYVRPGAVATPTLAERLRTLGRDPRGATWNMDGSELRVRLDPVPASASAASLGSLSLTGNMGNGRLWLGYRNHPGWRFGIYAQGGPAGRRAGAAEPGAFTDDGAFANPFLAFARNGANIGYARAAGLGSLRVAAVHGGAQQGERRNAGPGKATGLLAEYQLGGSGMSSLAVQTGWLGESRGLVGSRPSGAFGRLGADTAIVGLSAHRRLGRRWGLLASAYAGRSRATVRRNGMVRRLSSLWTSSLAAGIIGREVDRSGGTLAFTLSQPLRVESGRAEFRWASGRTPDGRVEIERAVPGLEPSGRGLDLELAYSRPWAGGLARLAAIASHDAGHVQGRNETVLLMRYSRRF